MPEKPKQVVEEGNVWRVGVLRLTAFRTASEIAPPDWWAKIVGNEPEQRTSKPKAGELVELGPYAEGNLILSVRPERIDWQYLPRPQEDQIVGFPDVGNLNPAMELFVTAMLKWIVACPPTTRLAFGASLLLPVDTREQGYAKLAEYLKFVKIDTENSSDFSYQINRKRKAHSVEGLSINRLSRWDVVSTERIQILLAAKMSAHSLPGVAFATHVDLDMNTSPEFAGNLPHDNLREILTELVQSAGEIASQGDIV
jgi:hypothetical protein